MTVSTYFRFLFLVGFFFITCDCFAQNKLPDLEPSRKHYKSLSKLDSSPTIDRKGLDTIFYETEDYQRSMQMGRNPLIYLSSQDSMLLHQLVKFPANSSRQTNAELEYLMNIQKTRTKKDIDTSLVLGKIAPTPIYPVYVNDSAFYQKAKELFFIAGSVGDSFNINNFPETGKLISNCMRDVKVSEFFLKVAFKRARPYHLEPKLEPVVRIATPAFPSGHTLWAYAQAYLFGEIIPEKRKDFLERADQVRWSREILGIHFPSDNEAARIISWYLLKYWYNNPQFVKDMEKAKAEWRSKKDMFK